MNTTTESHSLSRREAMLRALKGAVTAAVAAPFIVQAVPQVPAAPIGPEFVLENDYPFFGGEMPDAYQATPVSR